MERLIMQASRLDEAPAFIKKIVEWEWDWSVIYDKFVEISTYHIETYGWKAYLAIFLFIVIAGMSFQPTRHLTSLTLSNLFRGLGSVVGVIFTLFSFKAGESVLKALTSQIFKVKKSLKQDD